MTIDKAVLQILANRCAAAAQSMGYTLMRTAYSTFIKETEDFSCQLLTLEGKTFASPTTMGATWYTGLDYGQVIGMFDEYRAGDVYLTNDPYSGSVATHSPDVHIWKPVFSEGRLVCFVGCHVHNTDMGGAVPATLSRTLVEVQQEGLRIPPMLLLRDGVINQNLIDIMRINVRAPDQNRGDLNAQLACVNTGERKVLEIIERMGRESFEAGVRQLLDYAEQQARDIIRDIPDGDYTFADYADEDSENGYPVRVCVTVRVRGDEVVIDFTGTDPQLASALNMPTGGDERHALITVGFIYVLYALNPHIVLNAGTVRAMRAVLPQGTIVNAVHPAAVGMRSILCMVAQMAIIGAFSQALPDRLPAAPGSGISILNVKTTTHAGQTVMASIGPVGGGAGGNPSEDGAEGSGANVSFLKNTPVEINEAEVPIRIRRYGLVPDSGGAGRYRGGNATLMEFQLFAPNSMVTARNRDRSIMSAWGIRGGSAGSVSRFVKNPDSGAPVELGNTDIVMCEPGDILLVEGPGAGGYGHAYERPVEAVVADVKCGFVTRQRAAADYGVALGEDFSVDLAATAALRETLRARQKGGHFTHGEGRIAFEKVWTVARYRALTELLASAPVSWRYFIKHKIFASIRGNIAGEDGGAVEVLAAYAELAKVFPELPKPPAGGAGEMRLRTEIA
jgi:N-methylhydantoinase B